MKPIRIITAFQFAHFIVDPSAVTSDHATPMNVIEYRRRSLDACRTDYQKRDIGGLQVVLRRYVPQARICRHDITFRQSFLAAYLVAASDHAVYTFTTWKLGENLFDKHRKFRGLMGQGDMSFSIARS